MNDDRTEYLFYCFLTNKWSRFIITNEPMDERWVWRKGNKWDIGPEDHPYVVGRFDKIFEEYESRYFTIRS